MGQSDQIREHQAGVIGLGRQTIICVSPYRPELSNGPTDSLSFPQPGLDRDWTDAQAAAALDRARAQHADESGIQWQARRLLWRALSPDTDFSA
jgi:hypothetical protein